MLNLFYYIKKIDNIQFALLFFIVIFSVISGCSERESTEREKRSAAEQAHYDTPRAALQQTSPAFDIWVVLKGAYYVDESTKGFVGNLWISAKVANNTEYTFNDPAFFITPKEYMAGTKNEHGVRYPDRGIIMIPPPDLYHFDAWCPGDTFIFTAQIEPYMDRLFAGDEFDLIQWAFFEYLTISIKDSSVETLQLPPYEPRNIDNYVSTFYGLRGPFPVDCFRPECPYKKLPKDDPNYCGPREKVEFINGNR
jgi:hypothetical protein